MQTLPDMADRSKHVQASSADHIKMPRLDGSPHLEVKIWQAISNFSIKELEVMPILAVWKQSGIQQRFNIPRKENGVCLE